MDSKAEKKLAKLASNIKKSRKDKKKEAEQFAEINRLLQDSDEDVSISPKEMDLPVELSSQLSMKDKDLLPMIPPSIQVFDEKKTFSFFDENTLKLETFFKSWEKSYIFGKEVHILTDKGLRKSIQHKNYEVITADIDKCPSINLYIFHLLTVHSNLKFVKSCVEFLKYRSFKISSDDILTVLVNFGSTIEELCDSSFEIDLPRCENASGKFKKHSFPLFNMEMLAHLLIHYVNNNLVNFDWHFKHLIRALVKITLDPKIKNSGLVTLYSTLVSTLAGKAVENYGQYDVTSWLHLDNSPLPVQVEVCKILEPVNHELQQELIVRILDFIFAPKSLSIFPPIKVKDVKRILEEAKKKASSIIDTYYVLQLLVLILPTIDVTLKESQEINSLLASLENKILRKEDSTDVVRIKLDIAKLRNLTIGKTDSRFAMNECIQLSPVKSSKGRVI